MSAQNTSQASKPTSPGEIDLSSFRFERLVGILRRRWNWSWVFGNQFLQVLHRRFELRVFPFKSRVRQVIHDNVWIDTVTFDQPLALRPIHTNFRRRRHAAIHQPALCRKPHFPAPRSRADDLTQSKSLEAFAERFA